MTFEGFYSTRVMLIKVLSSQDWSMSQTITQLRFKDKEQCWISIYEHVPTWKHNVSILLLVEDYYDIDAIFEQSNAMNIPD